VSNNNQKFQVINQRPVSWKEDEKKNRKAGEMELVTGVLHTDGQLEEICSFPLPKDHAACPPGFYALVMEWAVSFDKKLVARVKALVPLTARPMGPVPPKAA